MYCTTFLTFGETFNPENASIRDVKTRKPSRIGMGRRFIMKSETLIKASKFKTDTIPFLRLDENPDFAVSPSIEVILAGPAILSFTSTPLKSEAIPLKERNMTLKVSENPR